MTDVDYPVNRSDANHDSPEECAQERQEQKKADTQPAPVKQDARTGMMREEAKLKLDMEKKWVEAEKERLHNARSPHPAKPEGMDGVDVVDVNEVELPL